MAAAGLLGPDLVSFPRLNGLSEAQRNYYQLRATICHSFPFGSQRQSRVARLLFSVVVLL